MESRAFFDVIPELYGENLDEEPRFIVNQGGTSSGKTYTIMQRLITLCLSHPRVIITVTGQDLPNLKVGAMRDLDTILQTSGNMALRGWFKLNKSECSYRAKNGSLIEFKSYQDAQDAKNGKRDYLFVNEANGITWEVFWQLAIRTRKQIFIDYNPSARFWVHNNIIGREDAKLVISDHRNNYFLTEQEHRKIEGISDPDFFLVYARGLTGKVSGLVFANWGIVDKMPPREEWKMEAYGMDFGFSNDPTALERLVLAHGELWVDEIIYQTGLTNPDIAEECKRSGITRRDMIVADCAEPKSIQELTNLGLWVVPSSKGADSILNGIDILKRYHINITRHSHGMIENLQQYRWRKTRDGMTTNQPVDNFNHGIDAIRYAALARFAARRSGAAKAHVVDF